MVRAHGTHPRPRARSARASNRRTLVAMHVVDEERRASPTLPSGKQRRRPRWSVSTKSRLPLSSIAAFDTPTRLRPRRAPDRGRRPAPRLFAARGSVGRGWRPRRRVRSARASIAARARGREALDDTAPPGAHRPLHRRASRHARCAAMLVDGLPARGRTRRAGWGIEHRRTRARQQRPTGCRGLVRRARAHARRQASACVAAPTPSITRSVTVRRSPGRWRPRDDIRRW